MTDFDQPAVANQSARERAIDLADRFAPAGTGRRGMLRMGIQVGRDATRYTTRLRLLWSMAHLRPPVEPAYRDWLAAHRVDVSDLMSQIDRFRDRPVPIAVTVIVLANRTTSGLAATLDSLTGQTMRAWSVVVVGPSNVTVPGDARMTHCCADTPAEIAQAVSELGTHVDADGLVVLLEAGDIAEPDLAFQLAANAWDNPFTEILYWDDDVLDVNGSPSAPRFRPSWSPEMLYSANYLGRSFALRGRFVHANGLPAVDGGAAGSWQYLLAADFTESQVSRIPRVLTHLGHRAAVSGGESVSLVGAHLAACNRAAEVTARRGQVHVAWEVPEGTHVSIVIPTRHNRANLARLLPSLARTDFASFDVIVMDNGERTPDNEAWYAAHSNGLDLTVTWWTAEPFNYSAVNNAGAARARGDVLVLLNDDTEILDPGWLGDFAGWALQPEIGLVGGQLQGPDGEIQHGGVVIGMNGFADHVFQGTQFGSDTLLGSTGWYRDSLSVTAACVALRRELWDDIGGFDERFVLCGGDVALGLDCRFRDLRNVVLPGPQVAHFESVTRGTTVPTSDFFASYWRYQKYLFGGDPYFSPALSLLSRVPQLRGASEVGPLVEVGNVLNRSFNVFRQKADETEAYWLADMCRADDELVDQVQRHHAQTVGVHPPKTVNWFFPDIDSPFYGGINTALRLADHLARNHGVQNQFVVMANPNESFFRGALEASFPSLVNAPMAFVDGSPTSVLKADLPAADVSIATLWVTAYLLARFPRTKRKFYLIQDFEPQFYPAGTNFALAEEAYRFGLYGLCNTERLLDIYRNDYDGVGSSFMPAVDQSVFHGHGRKPLDHDGPVTVFVYARPGHWRNCWELASLALSELKERLGERVRIVTAGSWARPEDLGRGITHLGLIDYRDTGKLYRSCDIGVALTVSAHPSYLPLELMACGTPVVAFDNPAGDWILHHDQNSLRCRRTVDGLSEALEALAVDPARRARLGAQALETIREFHSDWAASFSGIYDYLSDPESARLGGQ